MAQINIDTPENINVGLNVPLVQELNKSLLSKPTNDKDLELIEYDFSITIIWLTSKVVTLKINKTLRVNLTLEI